VRKPSNLKGFLEGVIENRSEWRERAQFREGNVMGRCLPCALSLHFEWALDFEEVGVSSLRQVFPHLSLGRQWSFFVTPSSVIFEFLVICLSMLWLWGGEWDDSVVDWRLVFYATAFRAVSVFCDIRNTSCFWQDLWPFFHKIRLLVKLHQPYLQTPQQLTDKVVDGIISILLCRQYANASQGLFVFVWTTQEECCWWLTLTYINDLHYLGIPAFVSFSFHFFVW
jgi:hypothetical protein